MPSYAKRRVQVDTTDDKDIDVYGDLGVDESEPENEPSEASEEPEATTDPSETDSGDNQ
ncbi:MAG: hypothetical protein LUD27_07335 [Clostridia bacterium]|nr:hypothetical protein [Clostridia bacterium]